MKHRFLIALLLVLSLASCSSSPLNIWGLPNPPTEGSPEYLQGWREGCETGTTSYGNSYLRSRYKVNVTPELMSNQDYRKAWSIGNRYCTYYTADYLKGGYIDHGSDLRGDDTFDIREGGFLGFGNSESSGFFESIFDSRKAFSAP